jgi:general secretion pathway protein E
LTTVHANNVFDALGRFTHLGIDPYSFVSALNGIWAQRLVRINCPHCSMPYQPSEEEKQTFQLESEPSLGLDLMAGQGCGDCRGTGYKGRRAVAEVLILTDDIRELIVDKAPLRQVKALARQQGTRTLRESAFALARRGETTLAEVNRVTLHA